MTSSTPAPHRRATRHLGVAALVAGAAVLSGCGSSAKSLSAPKAPATVASSAGPTAADTSAPAASATGSPDAVASAEASIEAGASAAATTSGGGSNPNSDFCVFAKKEEAASGKLGDQLATGTPDQVKSYIDQVNGIFKGFQAQAPDAIKGDIAVVAAAEGKLFAALKANGYSFMKAAPAVEAAVQDPAFMAATTKVSAYLKTTCGITDS